MSARLLMDLPREQYENLPGERWTYLKEMAESAAHYKVARDNPDREVDMTPEHRDLLRRGAAGHVATLEPEKYGGVKADQMPLTRDGTLYAYWPAANQTRNSNAYKGFEANCQQTGRVPLRERDHDWCMRIAAAVRSNPAAQRYLTGPREVSMQWEHVEPAVGAVPGFAVQMKGRIDKVATQGEKPFALIDLKALRSARPDKFGRQAFDMALHAQAALYVDGYFACTGLRLPFAWIVVGEKPPHNVVVYRARPLELALGRQYYRDLLQKLNACNETGAFPGYAAGEMDLEFPSYAYPDDVYEEEAA